EVVTPSEPAPEPAAEPGPELPGVPLPPIGAAPASPTPPAHSGLPRPLDVRRLESGPEAGAKPEARTMDRVPDVLPPPTPADTSGSLPAASAPDFPPHDVPAYAPNAQCFYGRAEFLLWWLTPDRVPPLVTAGDPARVLADMMLVNPTNTAGRGILGQ